MSELHECGYCGKVIRRGRMITRTISLSGNFDVLPVIKAWCGECTTDDPTDDARRLAYAQEHEGWGGIVRFLLARFAEDEEAARDALRRNADADPYNTNHIMGWWPAQRVIYELEIKHKIVLEGEPWIEDVDLTHSSQMADAVYSKILRQMASIYWQHPDYNREWAL
jgi:hypothetical protein